MKTLLLSVLSLILVGTLNAQQGAKTTKRNVEVNKRIDNKVAYNYFLLDMIRDIDVVYGEYEELIQRAWSKRIDLDLKGSSGDYLKRIDAIGQTVEEMPIFKGGDDYQKSVLEYTDVVKEKITLLERYGILGTIPDSDINEYNDAEIAFNEATNKGIEVRNKVRKLKSSFEKKTYIQ
ncbi:hypothetical protein [Dysgonomonas sp. BGC7]|mgnify:CR=1 FL=1|uniref:hypothetical protein n=1 Tax=Dysgonomonas sp. BGC7 TaxID=1658008 RepID=UPI000680BAAD|nr:hypothetical protein [Dysgonomonas sp. BGC7]MBD8390128.1 hypothetical protein [Dysgonomonas sp. BGC7]